MKVIVVVGARPNFIKIGPLMPVFAEAGIDARLVHTGQHYDAAMSDTFFHDLGLPHPDWFLGIGSGTHATQTGKAMVALEELILSERPDALFVVGDVNSTLAGALAAAKTSTPVVHLEAGLRSFDMSMPEEVNRLVTDQLSAMLLTPSEDAETNLLREGVESRRIHFVGNVMAESLLKHEEQARRRSACARFGLSAGGFVLATVHRPENTGSRANMRGVVQGLAMSGSPVLLPAHPRSAESLRALVDEVADGDFQVVQPVGYLDMLSLIADASAVVTDSGGIQEEACLLHTPCVTVRRNTERNVTITLGANRLVGADAHAISEALHVAVTGSRDWPTPARWDEHVSARVVEALAGGIMPLQGTSAQSE